MRLRTMYYRTCFFTLALGIAISAAAQTPEQLAACSGEVQVSFDDQISACTAVIHAPVTVQDRAAALRNRSWAYLLKRDHDAAIIDCTEALRLLPDDRTNVYGCTYNRANAYDGKGDYDRAIEDYTQLLQFDTNSPNLFNSRGNAYTGKGAYALAMADYSRSIDLNTNISDVGDELDVGTTLANRCQARALAGDFKKALEDCEAAIKLEPNEPVPLSSRGFVYLKMGRNDEALADYDASVRLGPKRPLALYGRAIAKLRKGDAESSKVDVDAAKAIWPGVADFFARYYGIR
jgi:tetratricopeptide (TPR) repeat protein